MSTIDGSDSMVTGGRPRSHAIGVAPEQGKPQSTAEGQSSGSLASSLVDKIDGPSQAESEIWYNSTGMEACIHFAHEPCGCPPYAKAGRIPEHHREVTEERADNAYCHLRLIRDRTKGSSAAETDSKESVDRPELLHARSGPASIDPRRRGSSIKAPPPYSSQRKDHVKTDEPIYTSGMELDFRRELLAAEVFTGRIKVVATGSSSQASTPATGTMPATPLNELEGETATDVFKKNVQLSLDLLNDGRKWLANHITLRGEQHPAESSGNHTRQSSGYSFVSAPSSTGERFNMENQIDTELERAAQSAQKLVEDDITRGHRMSPTEIWELMSLRRSGEWDWDGNELEVDYVTWVDRVVPARHAQRGKKFLEDLHAQQVIEVDDNASERTAVAICGVPHINAEPEEV